MASHCHRMPFGAQVRAEGWSDVRLWTRTGQRRPEPALGNGGPRPRLAPLAGDRGRCEDPTRAAQREGPPPEAPPDPPTAAHPARARSWAPRRRSLRGARPAPAKRPGGAATRGGLLAALLLIGGIPRGHAEEGATGGGEGAVAPPSEQVLETLFVTAPADQLFGPISETHHRLEPATIENLRADSADQLVRRLPSAHVPTNSRGESLVYLRSAGERQVAAFFDGALLNVPWDNRFDLGIFPASIIHSITTATGTLSPQYGVNALGAVAIFPHSAATTDDRGWLDLRAGTQHSYGVDAAVVAAAGNLSALGAGVLRTRDGFALSGEADIPFHQYSDDTRTNTDAETASAFVRAESQFDGGELAGTLLMSRTEQGIAPEGYRETGARFWRYPEIETLMGILNGDMALGDASELRGAAWVQHFEQTIDSYEDDSYRTIADREEDRDRTYGARAILTSALGPAQVTGSVNYLRSEHRQRDIGFDAGGPPAVLPAALTYEQQTGSIGVDLEYPLRDALTLELGLGEDWVDYVETGDKPPIEEFFEPVARLGLAWEPNETTRLRGAVGRKSRMPTMRELFGTAINRFLINPDLQPEKITTAELALDYEGPDPTFSLILFGQDVDDTIDQRQVGSLRQRVNLEGSWVLGVEFAGTAEITPAWHLRGNLMAARTRRKEGPEDTSDRLPERPSVLARLALDYERPDGARAGAEIEHTGRAYSLDENGELVPLEISTQLNLYASYPLGNLHGGPASEVYLRVQNLTDTYVEPQLGLPAPGRTIFGGLRLTW